MTEKREPQPLVSDEEIDQCVIRVNSFTLQDGRRIVALVRKRLAERLRAGVDCQGWDCWHQRAARIVEED